jgi:hypothetical protein
MSDFDQSIVSVSARVGHEWDFAFYKNNGEMANRLRAELGSSLKEIRIDKDGDIEIDTVNEGNFIITPGTVIATGWLTNSKTLSGQQEIEKFANIVERLVKSKGSFTTEFFNVRLFFRFRPENSLNLLRDRGYESSLRLILGEKAPSDVRSFKFSTASSKDKFFDSIELEASTKDVQLRYSRSATDFDSYSEFVEAANLPGLLEELKPFAEILIAAEPRGLGSGLLGVLSDLK